MMEICEDLKKGIVELIGAMKILNVRDCVEWDINRSSIYRHKIRQQHMLVCPGCCADMVHVPRGIIHKPHNRRYM